MTETTKQKLKKLFKNLVNDISYSNGGILFFFVRVFINIVIMYYFLGFLKSFLLFTFAKYGIFGDYTKPIITILWAFGMIFLIYSIPITSKEIKEIKR